MASGTAAILGFIEFGLRNQQKHKITILAKSTTPTPTKIAIARLKPDAEISPDFPSSYFFDDDKEAARDDEDLVNFEDEEVEEEEMEEEEEEKEEEEVKMPGKTLISFWPDLLHVPT